MLGFDEIRKNRVFRLEQGYLLGVTGTSTFFVGTEGKYTLIEVVQPFKSFKQAIDAVL